MKKPKTTFLILSFFFACFFWVCTNPTDDGKTCADGQLSPIPDSVVNFLNTGEYKNWKILTGEGSLKRLGLPVHGRWVRTYINPTAEAYFNQILAEENPKLPVVFPCGSFFVKENYGQPDTARFVDQKESGLGVLTVIYKPKGDYCATSTLAPYNGTDCYGGEWFYGFFNRNHETKKFEVNHNVQNTVESFCINCHAAGYKADYIRTLSQMKFPYSQPPTEPYCASFDPKPKKGFTPSDSIPQAIKDCVEKLDAFCENISLDNTLPADVPCDPRDIMEYYGPEATQKMFDCYGWRTFMALNFPNVPYTNEHPKRGAAVSVDSFNIGKNFPRVWETYKTAYEVFQPEDPEWNPVNQKWDEARPYPVGKNNSCQCEGGDLVLTMPSKTRDVPNETGQAFAGTFGYVIGRNGKEVRYEVLFNRTEFEYIIGEDRAATKNITPGGPAKNGELTDVRFPDNRTDTLYNMGAIEVKSAWKELVLGIPTSPDQFFDAPDLPTAEKEFYVRRLLVYDEVNDSCRYANMALIGLHVIHKTHFAPQWIWMTYEHKNNVPDSDNTKSNDYAFFNPAHEADSQCFTYPFVSKNPKVRFCPNVDINRFVFRNQPNQLTRLVKIDDIAKSLNEKFQGLFAAHDSPFKNYILVNVQWPINGRKADGTIAEINCADNGRGEDCFTMQPQFLRNSVIESYMSAYCTVDGKNQQFSNRSCMSCHGQVGSDFSYIWLDGVSQRVPIKF